MGVYILAMSALASVPFLVAFFIALCRDDDRKPIGSSVGASAFVREAKAYPGRTNLLSFPPYTEPSNMDEIAPTGDLNVEAR